MDPTDARRVVIATCRRMGADPDSVISRDRRAHVAVARRACMVAMRGEGASMRTIARFFGRALGTVGWILSPKRMVATRTVAAQCCGHATGCD